MLANLLLARKKLKMTQKQLAAKAGSSHVKISRFENGQRMPKADELKRIAEVLNVTVDYLLKETS